MIARPMRRLLFACAALILAVQSAPAQAQSGEAGRSEVVRVRMDDPKIEIFQVFLDRKPVTLLYRKGSEVGLELIADEDGIPCRHDVAVVTADGRLADVPGVNLCEKNWVVVVEASKLTGGGGGSSAEPAQAEPADAEPADAASPGADGNDTRDEAADDQPDSVETRGSSTATGSGSASGDDNCGWFAIMACRRDKASAERESTRIMGGVNVIATDDYDGLNPGLFCAAQGPYATREEAEQNAAFFRRKSAPEAYTKQACEAGGGQGADSAAPDGDGQDGQPAAGGQAGAPAAPGQAAAESFGWTFAPPAGGSDAVAMLTYGDPRTGAIEMVGTCTPGTGGVAVTINRAPPAAVTGATVNVILATEAFRGRYPAKVGAPDADTGAPTVDFTTSADDDLWRALAGHFGLRVEMDGQQPFDVSLRGSAGPVRQFAAMCAAGGEGPETLGGGQDAQDEGAPVPADVTAGSGGVPPAASFACRRGPGLEVFFPRRGARAVVSVDGDEPIVLNRSGPETIFRAGPFELSVDGDRATWNEGGGVTFTCIAR